MFQSQELSGAWFDATFSVVRSVLGARRLAFYKVTETLELTDFVCSGVPDAFHETYLAGMHRVDPLHMRRIALRCDRVARLCDAIEHMDQGSAAAYRRFLYRFDALDSYELLFRRDGRVCAGMSVIWTAHDRLPSPDLVVQAEGLQSYIEYTLAHIPAPSRRNQAREARRLYQLTAREADVLQLLCIGRSNADIAKCLDISIATVKTHLVHIYEKSGADNRSALVAAVSQLI